MVRIVDNGDGTRTFYVDQDRLEGAALLDGDDAPELTDEQFERLTNEMREVHEEEEEQSPD